MTWPAVIHTQSGAYRLPIEDIDVRISDDGHVRYKTRFGAAMELLLAYCQVVDAKLAAERAA